MDATVVHTDTHAIVSGNDRSAVQSTVMELAREGAKLASIQLVGARWIASCELPKPEQDGPFVIDRFGTHVIVRGDNQHQLMEKVREMIASDGYALISGPIIHERLWICVLGATGKTR